MLCESRRQLFGCPGKNCSWPELPALGWALMQLTKGVGWWAVEGRCCRPHSFKGVTRSGAGSWLNDSQAQEGVGGGLTKLLQSTRERTQIIPVPERSSSMKMPERSQREREGLTDYEGKSRRKHAYSRHGLTEKQGEESKSG